MQHTLIAVFDNRSDAQKALEELVSSGFTRGQARLSEGDPGAAASTASGTGAAGGDGKFLGGIRHFFSDIFGTERHETARMYSEAVARGHYVLTLTADSVKEVERAADLVERFGPIDIDEHAQQWAADADTARYGGGAQQQAQPASQQYAQGTPQGAQQGSAQGSQQGGSTAVPVNQPGPAAGQPQSRGGVRIYQHLDSKQLAAQEDAYFRSHWTSIYAEMGGKYDEYGPAYTYGSSMARSDAYRGREWDEVEGKLRSDWEARHPGSAWDKFKAAVRHGWERITS